MILTDLFKKLFGPTPIHFGEIIKIQKVHPDAIIPTYAHEDDACCDLYSIEDYILQPGERKLLRTGIAIEIPPCFEVQLRPRSGLALKYGVTVVNAPGTIDSQYRNEVKVLLVNMGNAIYGIRKGDRIAQMALKLVYKMQFEEVNKLSHP